jgi:hypothetical protein
MRFQNIPRRFVSGQRKRRAGFGRGPLAYLPKIFYRYGQDEAAYAEILALSGLDST